MSAGFALFLLLVVGLWFVRNRQERCPQCHAARDLDSPLCRGCGWIFELPGDDDDDYGEPEPAKPWD